MNIDAMLNALRSEQEKDEAQAVAWVNATSDADILRVWMAIQKMGGDDMSEIISRCAQLGMSHAVLLAKGGKP